MNIESKDILVTRSQLKENVLNNKRVIGYEKQRKQLLNLLKESIYAGESNSALLLGLRSVGKTLLVKSILQELQNDSFEKNAILVCLNGLIHTDDRLALKAITTQMNLDNAVDGKVFGSFAENLAFLLACLKSGSKETTKSIIFILEEFHLFCSHHNQTLLYNLFDVSQSAQTPICVLGITFQLEIIESLEKRVKSRFSHRQIFLSPKEDHTFEIDRRLKRIQNVLCLKPSTRLSKKYVNSWNRHIEDLIDDEKFHTFMQRVLEVDPGEQTLNNLMFLVVSQLNDRKTRLTLKDFEDQYQLLESEDIFRLIRDLSVLEVCLLIAMKHYIEINDTFTFNFEIILTRYNAFVNSHSNIQEFQRATVLKAFEHLQNLRLIGPVSGVGLSALQKEYQNFELLLPPEQIVEAIPKLNYLPTEVAQWATSDLI
ncbi:hypothetical protein PPYR_00380 [Photinus pyralis]|uniref:Origin recognition complex subunit 4 n=1 Tax=Photinus pyralis TaxID=7054 RepID=A0A1Y1LQ05_PHOPY|nr:origin recognition complex subunit 4 [Photinus pyralis]KAB0803410.1 hypothetical protein PPYR_00380 [Photinus pyralis]